MSEFFRHISDDNSALISVYDYSIADAKKQTYETTVHKLVSSFQPDIVQGAALNFLDIENWTRLQFCPHPIILKDF